jgi:hypothetical protein
MANESGVPRNPDERTTQHALLCETVARHFPEARIDRDTNEVELGFGDLTIACRVNAVHDHGATQSASLFFYLRAGRLGAFPVFASVSGYADNAERAIISGGCNWCCVFGPVLRAGLAGESQADVARFEIAVDGQNVRVFVDGLDRAFSSVGHDASGRISTARSRLAPHSWLTRVVLASGRLPLLAANRPTLLSTFVSDTATARTVEVKVDGCDWSGMTAAFDDAAPEAEGGGVLMRELAVVVPLSAAPPLTRAPIERTLRGIAERNRAAVGHATAWPGPAHHGYALALAPPLPVQELVALEAQVGQLPADYRDYLATVSGFGAGPGYGILAPRGELQMSCARGEFDWDDGEEPVGPPAGVLCLAHAGCG